MSIGTTFLWTGRLVWALAYLRGSAATFLIFASLPAVTHLMYFLNVAEPRGPRWLPWVSLFAIGVVLLVTPFLVAGNVSLAIGPVYLLVLYGVFIKLGRADLPDAVPDPTCVSCGYSLRGNASGRCPECGKRRVSRAIF